MRELLSRISAPKEYFKILDIEYPDRIDVEFIVNLTKKAPAKESILSFEPRVESLAKKIGVWDKSFDVGITARELIEKGFKGKAIGDELERLKKKKIENLKNKI